MPYTIATAIEKGGVAKTTTAIHLGIGLAQRGIRTTIIDLDPQTNATQWLFGDDSEPSPTIYDVLEDYRKTPMPAAVKETRYPGLSLVPGDRGLGGADDMLSQWPNKVTRDPKVVLRDALSHSTLGTDVVIIDCPPSVGILNGNAIISADHLLIPIRPAKLSYNGFLQLGLTIRNLMEVGAISGSPDITVVLAQLMTRRKKNDRYRKKVLAIAEEAGNDRVYVCDASIRYRDIMDEIPDYQVTGFDSIEELRRHMNARDAASAQLVRDDYVEVLDEFMTRVETLTQKRAIA